MRVAKEDEKKIKNKDKYSYLFEGSRYLVGLIPNQIGIVLQH